MVNLVIGAGITGITIARLLAEKGEQVIIIDERCHIGGNCYDSFEHKNYKQVYGPHIFHTDDVKVFKYLSKFTKWNKYKHKVYCNINKKLVNIPFNLNSIDIVFNKNKAEELKRILLNEFGYGKKIPILQLMNSENKLIKELAMYVYKNIFLNYTIKQWDLKPEQLDFNVTARVPVFISKDDLYFQDKYQGIPVEGFTKMFHNMLKHKNICICLGVNHKEYNLKHFDKVFYTGALDSFFNYKLGDIKYRKIILKFETKNVNSFQENSVINYPNNREYTRITEFNKFLFLNRKKTLIGKEYASWDRGFLAYPVQSEDNFKMINKYLKKAKTLKNVYFIGRLAEGKYYNMDQCVKKAMDLVGSI
jgi:UDP-galactopyranose mutase